MPNFEQVAVKKVNTVSSLEVAEMLDKEHKYVLRDIEGTDKVVGIIPTLTGANLHSLDYFMESTYIDAKGESRKCYLITKMGCELLGNKQQGEKGILFTAKYVKRFNDMENVISEKLLPTTYRDAVAQLLESLDKQAEQQQLIEYQEPLVQLAETRIDNKGCFSITDVTKSLGLKRGNITRWAKEEGYLHKTQMEVNKQGEEYFKVYSSDAKHNQIGVLEKGLQLIKENIDQVKRS